MSPCSLFFARRVRSERNGRWFFSRSQKNQARLHLSRRCYSMMIISTVMLLLNPQRLFMTLSYYHRIIIRRENDKLSRPSIGLRTVLWVARLALFSSIDASSSSLLWLTVFSFVQPMHTAPVQSCPQPNNSGINASSSFDNEILRETLLELDRIVEKDIKELEAECHRHAGHRSQPGRSGHAHQQRSRSVDSRRHLRPPPRPPTSSSTAAMANHHHSSSSSHAAEEHRLYEHRMQMEKTITTRTHSAPRLNLNAGEAISSLRKINITGGGPITMLYKIPPPPFSRSSSSSSLSTETTLRVSSPEPDDRLNEPLKPLYITEIMVPSKPSVRVPQPGKTTVVTITDKTEIERRNREIERLEHERRTLLTEKELLLQEIDRYKHRPSKSFWLSISSP